MEALDHKCLSCDANLKFNPSSQTWICEYCGNEYTLKDLSNNSSNKNKLKYDEKDIESNSTIEEIPESKYTTDEFDCYHCKNCGAKLVTDKTTTATFCVYCGNTSIIKERLENAFEPHKIIPFKKTKQDAISTFMQYKKNKWFAPKDFHDNNNIKKITGVYIPFWTYDCTIDGDLAITGERRNSWRSGDYIVTKIDTYNIKRQGSAQFNKVPVDGSKKFADDVMDSIEPFNYDELVDFNISYLSGFLSECYDVTKEEAFSRASKRMQNTMLSLINSTIQGYQNKRINHSKFDSNISSIKYFLLPVWMLNIKYKDKIYLFAMNGQTGKMVGDIPVCKTTLIQKWLIYAAISFITSFLILFILSFF